MKHKGNHIHNTTLANYLLALFVLPTLLGCVQDMPKQTQGNRWDLYCTLVYYKYIERDTAKYAAACFLIENMPYHHSRARIYRDNETLELWRHETDSIYYSIVQGVKMDKHTNTLILMRKKIMMLSCIAAVTIASFVDKKAFEPHAYETKDLLLQNVEALTSENSVIISKCKGNTDVCAKGVDEETGKEITIHGKLVIIANV